MAYDIYAHRRGFRSTDHARDEAYADFERRTKGKDGDTWLTEYQKLQRQINVAYFRRSMGYHRSPVRDLLYIALGDKAQRHNAGVSGDGGSEIFGLEELCLAQRLVFDKRKTLVESGQPRSVAVELTEDEADFLRACIAYAAGDERREIEINFG